MPQHACTNPKCGWSGTLAIEVSVEDYMKFVEEKGIKIHKDNSSN